MDAGGGLRVHLVTSDFASHAGWAAEYAAHSRHRVSVARVAGARWKWRMLAGTPQLASPPPCDVLVVDGGMMDCSAAVAELRRLRKSSCPAVVLYMHENQLTTPFAANDRDVRRGTSWHFGAAHIRSLQCADAVLFNSATHLEQFAVALPRLINEQSPRDTVRGIWQRRSASSPPSAACCTTVCRCTPWPPRWAMRRPRRRGRPPSCGTPASRTTSAPAASTTRCSGCGSAVSPFG